MLAGNSGVETILKNVPDVQAVMVKTKGPSGSSFGRASGAEPSLTKYLKKYLLALLANGPLFSPRRKVNIEVVQNTTVATLADRRAINSYLETFYNSEAEKNKKTGSTLEIINLDITPRHLSRLISRLPGLENLRIIYI